MTFEKSLKFGSDSSKSELKLIIGFACFITLGILLIVCYFLKKIMKAKRNDAAPVDQSVQEEQSASRV